MCAPFSRLDLRARGSLMKDWRRGEAPMTGEPLRHHNSRSGANGGRVRAREAARRHTHVSEDHHICARMRGSKGGAAASVCTCTLSVFLPLLRARRARVDSGCVLSFLTPPLSAGARARCCGLCLFGHSKRGRQTEREQPHDGLSSCFLVAGACARVCLCGNVEHAA